MQTRQASQNQVSDWSNARACKMQGSWCENGPSLCRKRNYAINLETSHLQTNVMC